MAADLAAHDETLRAAIESHGGWLFKHSGDGVYAAFSSPRGAIDAAIEAQRSLRLPVRMGIATGEVESRGDDYFGPALNRTARIMAVGHGGQVLVSGSTAGLVTGIDLWDLGEHRLRDLSGVERVFQVRADGLAVEFPPLRTIDAVPGNLPVQSTSFVGRDVEVKDLAELVRGASAGDPDRRRWGRQDPPGGPGRRRAGAASSPTECGSSSWPRSVIRRRCPTRWPRCSGSCRRPAGR